MTLEVLEPGLLSTVQDLGRPDWTHLGVPIGGACDPWSLAVANLLVGNEMGAPTLEMTLIGAVLRAGAATVVGLAGADLGGTVRETGRRLEPGRSHWLAAGSTIAFPGDTSPESGARAYLALPGGLDVPLVLGSASTAVAAGFGGMDGRALRTGDRLRGRERAGGEARPTPMPDEAGMSWPVLEGDPFAEIDRDAPVRLIAGPAAGSEAIAAGTWRVGSGSDRVGIRLEGLEAPPVETAVTAELLSHGVVRGAVQLPPGGTPIVLLADHQTTGGYPVVAVAITADHPRLGQLRPGASVRFAVGSLGEAHEALTRQRAALDRGAAMVREQAGWDALWQSAR